MPNEPIDPVLGHIRQFATHPNWTRRGIGRALFERCVADARAAGVCTFECYSSIGAERFYRALGSVEPMTLALADSPSQAFECSASRASETPFEAPCQVFRRCSRTWHASHNEADTTGLFASRPDLFQPSVAAASCVICVGSVINLIQPPKKFGPARFRSLLAGPRHDNKKHAKHRAVA
jgi:hypothetical protein